MNVQDNGAYLYDIYLVSERKLLRDCPKSPLSTHDLHAERSRSILSLQHLCHLSTPLKVKDGAFGVLHYYQIEFLVKHYLGKSLHLFSNSFPV